MCFPHHGARWWLLLCSEERKRYGSNRLLKSCSTGLEAWLCACQLQLKRDGTYGEKSCCYPSLTLPSVSYSGSKLCAKPSPAFGYRHRLFSSSLFDGTEEWLSRIGLGARAPGYVMPRRHMRRFAECSVSLLRVYNFSSHLTDFQVKRWETLKLTVLMCLELQGTNQAFTGIFTLPSAGWFCLYSSGLLGLCSYELYTIQEKSLRTNCNMFSHH